MTLHEWLARQRKKGKFTQRAFAKLSGVSEPHICDILKGYKRPGPDVARKISAATNGQVKLETLLFGDR